MKTREYREYVKAQQAFQKAQITMQAKQKAMLAAFQSTPEYKLMLNFRQSVEKRVKDRGERMVVDWATGELKPAPAPAATARR